MDDVKLNRPAEFANQLIRLCMRILQLETPACSKG
jgi:hypothetical protein